jgi:hypothetical protein
MPLNIEFFGLNYQHCIPKIRNSQFAIRNSLSCPLIDYGEVYRFGT